MALFGLGSKPSGAADPESARARLVQRLHDKSKVSDPRILDAFARVPRHRFVPEARRQLAYDDRALPLFEQQTISQPSMIAIMLESLGCEPEDRVLEVGAGCGYAAALLGELTAEVHGVEIRPRLVEYARSILAGLDAPHVRVHQGDGRLGLTEHAPFQRILVSAAASEVPSALLDQLDVGGRIAIPLDDRFGQTLMIGDRRSASEVRWTRSVPCLWVPLVAGP